MAIPIKDTPVLRGADAKRFRIKMEQDKDKKVSSEELTRIKSNFAKLNAISKF